MVRQAPVICVMAPPIHLGAWSLALMLWLPFELLFYMLCCSNGWVVLCIAQEWGGHQLEYYLQ